ncbi:hypothetical protein O3P69_009193 [Scylla paramamosain]|uniref:N-acetyltransferase domain-containing protein n=1 Tax=Scylla paramamosain TaxID=85552 RepID=A0AAW0TCS2_SCYPA
MRPPAYTPNMSCGPCVYCGASSEGQPQELVSCGLCRRPLHLACLKGGPPQTNLLGDNFFLVTCAVCSPDGVETVQRANMTDLQMLMLTLYNIHMTEKYTPKLGFYHWKIHIAHALLNNYWKEIEVSSKRNKGKKKKILIATSTRMSHHPRYFQSGIGVLGEAGWYRLVNVAPPAQLLAAAQRGDLGNKGGSGQRGALPDGLPVENPEEPPPPSPPPSSPPPPPAPLPMKCEPQEGGEEWSAPPEAAWFTEKGLLMQQCRPPEALLEWEDQGREAGVTHDRTEEDIKEEVTVKEEAIEEEIFEAMESEENVIVDEIKEEEEEHDNAEYEEEDLRGGGGVEMRNGREMRPSLFPPPSSTPPLMLHWDSKVTNYTGKNLRRLSRYEEKGLLRHLERLSAPHPLPPHLHRLRRKLIVRNQKVEHGLPVFNVDQEVEYWRIYRQIRSRRERMEQDGKVNTPLTISNTRILDRFQMAGQQQGMAEEHNISFAARLGSSFGSDGPPALIHSPYTLRYLKPFIRRDHDCLPLKLQLLREVVSRHHQQEAGWVAPPPAPIDYCYVTARHIPPMNQLARHFFWPGIDLSEVLQYPDHTCVVLYRRLVVGFGVVVPDTGYNEAYLSYLLVHPEWRRVGIASFVLYHLIQTCPGKDVTLHVSATNPALILYQQFGFKVEEFLSNFYDKYLPHDSPECKHAMYMRLRR